MTTEDDISTDCTGEHRAARKLACAQYRRHRRARNLRRKNKRKGQKLARRNNR